MADDPGDIQHLVRRAGARDQQAAAVGGATRERSPVPLTRPDPERNP
jgi:hypothetical protein